MPSLSVELFRTTILKVGSNGEIVREIKRNQQLNSYLTCLYGMVYRFAALRNPEIAGSGANRSKSGSE